MNRRDDLHKAIDDAVTPRPDQNKIYQTRVPDIPRKGERAYEYTDNGLVIRRELTEKDWHTIHSEIRAVSGSSRALNIGDAALYGFERNLISTFEEAAELFKAPVDSIKIYVSICRNVPQLIRVNSLTFKHYRYIAPLPDDEKLHWIMFAASNNLSSGNLKKLIDLVNPPQLTATAEASDTDNTTIAPAVEPEDTDPPPPKTVYVHSLPAAVKDKSHHQRMNYIWKKVEHDEPMTDEDLGDVWLIKKWCDMLIERNRKQK